TPVVLGAGDGPLGNLGTGALRPGVAGLSLGTNDLSQYTFAAANRMQGELAGLLGIWQPALLDIIKMACDGGRITGKTIGVCGEAGGDPLLALVLCGLGVSSLSMAVGKIKAVKTALRLHDLGTCQRMADAARRAKDAKERQLPELDDEFAQLASEFDTIDELKADVAEQTATQKKFEQGAQARDKVLEQLLTEIDIPLPESIVEAEIEQHFASGHEDGSDNEEHRAEVDKNTREALKAQFLLDAIAEQEDVQVGQQELIEYLVMSAQQYGMDPNQFAQLLDGQGQVPAMVAEVARRKALASVLEKVTIKDGNGDVVDLSELDAELEDGSEDDDVDEVALDEVDDAQDAADEGASDESADDAKA
ncbi:hypothetical protein MM440_05830, partial [Arsenicicoccus piscis]|uniref:trigger factor n=1 Tax=Arsenicicoccus piscis TaxID=673954 RepID=UPI0030C6DF1E|nr:hypothetical protein [Arsenicicoccus piscis]